MLLECHNCGAPLDVQEGASTVRCNYCGQSSKTEQHKTVAFQTPPDWKPPQEWRPPAGSSFGDAVLVYKPAIKAARALIRGLVFSGVLTVAIGGFIAYQVTSSVNRATNGALAGLAQPDVTGEVAQALAIAGKAARSAAEAARKARQAAGGGVPVVCSGNDDVTLTDENLTMPSGVPVVATGNCRLHLVRCAVQGTTALTLKDNATATIEGGTFTSERGPALVASNNATVDVSQGASFSGEPALVAGNNAQVTLRGAVVSGKTVAISTSSNATVDTSGATISGAVVGKRAKKR